MKLNSVLLLSPPFGGGSVTVYPDLVAACVGELRATPAVVSALGDAAGTPKIFSDKNTARTVAPYIVFNEPEETREYMAGGSFLARGRLVIDVYASGKLLARDNAKLIAATLSDADLLIDNARVAMIRARVLSFSTVADTAPGEPVVYLRVVSVDYLLVGSL